MSTAVMLGLVAVMGALAFRSREIWGSLGVWHPMALALIGLAFVYFAMAGEGSPYVDLFFALLAFGLALRSYREDSATHRDTN